MIISFIQVSWLKPGACIFLLLACFGTAHKACSQTISGSATTGPAVRFETHGVNDGLSQSTVTSIFQDHLGFMWFGTVDGLNRFDGVEFEAFRTIPSDSTSISATDYYEDDRSTSIDDDPSVRAITEDAGGSIWVGTRRGADRLDRATGTFRRFHYRGDDPTSIGRGVVIDVLADRSGRVWAGTWGGGLSWTLAADPGSFVTFRNDPDDSSTIASDRILFLLEDASGRLWVGTNVGLDRLDDQSGTFDHILSWPEESGVFPGDMIADDRSDTVFWFTRSGASGGSLLVRLDAVTGETQQIRVADVPVTGLARDPYKSGVLWISTVGQALVRFDVESWTTTRVESEPLDRNRLPSDLLSSVYTDATGSVWVGTFQSGVSRFDPSAGDFGHLKPVDSGFVVGLMEDRVGRLWMGFSGRVTRLDRRTGIRRHWDFDDPSWYGSELGFVSGLLEAEDGTVWIGSEGGLSRLDPDSGRLVRFEPNLDDPQNSPCPGSVNVVVQDDAGGLWSGNEGCVSRRDAVTGRFERYEYDHDDDGTIAAGTVYDIDFGRGDAWILSAGGLARLDPSNGAARRFVHDPNDERSLPPVIWGSLLIDGDGKTVWAGTMGGLARVDTESGEVFHYSTQNSDLPSNWVLGIVRDDEGKIWLSTNHGLSQFSPNEETFRNFDTNDGLHSLEFSGGTSMIRSKLTGEILVGDFGGITYFDPGRFGINTIAPPVVVTDFKLFNRSVVSGPDSPLSGDISETKSITLDHNENAVSFDFAALHYKNAGLNRYRYRLEPYETEWVDVSDVRSATYTNVAPGRYTFRVIAANSDGIWNREGTSIDVHIRPPWWRTGWAYGLFALLIAGVLFGTDRWQRRRVIRQERERSHGELMKAHMALEKSHDVLEQTHEELKSAQARLVQSEKMASLGKLTAGIAHEIRNPLNFVTNFASLSVEMLDELSEELDRETERPVSELADELREITTDLKSNVTKIMQHGHRANRIVEGMLEHSRSGSGQKRRVRLNALVEETIEQAQKAFESKNPGFDCEIERHYDPAVGDVTVMPQEIGRVFLNILSNAFHSIGEAARPRPLLRVSTQRDGTDVIVTIADNGTGIAPETRSRVFEPFYTTKPTGQGTGLGLSLAYDIVVQGHGGGITIEDTEGGGATFVVRIQAERLEALNRS